MKLLVFLIHFCVTNLFPLILIFLIFGDAARLIMVGLWLLLWVVSYFYIDKIILFFLGAREIIDNDFQELFQQFKSETYKRFEKRPKVYLYTGHSQKCFVFDSRREWSVVLDRSLAEKLNPEQVKALVDYLVRYKKTGAAWRLTKSLGLVILGIGLIYSFWSKLFMLDTNSRLFKVLALFTLALFKPFFDAILAAGKSSKSLECDESLAAIINVSKDLNPGVDYARFIFDHAQESVALKELLVKYLESFSIIENARVKRSF